MGKAFKFLTGVEDISLLRKNIHKIIGKLLYYKKYNAKDIVEVMKTMGMHAGSVVCIHASMKEFYNFEGTAENLIQEILDVITPEGTLLMPAYPDQRYVHDKDYVFDPINDKTCAGYLAETFRLFPNVVRSINVQHSVCAWGKYAEWLIKDHQHCKNCWDENSPWYRMTRLNALNFTLGLPSHYIGTFDHCVEAILYKEHPYWAQFFNASYTYSYYNNEKNISRYSCIEGNLERRTRELRLMQYFSKEDYIKRKLSNLLIQRFDTKTCLDKMIELGRKGITMYYVPSPKSYQFDE